MLKQIFDFVTKNECSDLHLSADNYPMARYVGELIPIEGMQKLTVEFMDKFIQHILSEEQHKEYQNNNEIDFALNIDGGHRFRANVFRSLTGPAVALRPIARKIRTLEEIHAPPIVKDLIEKKNGLIVVSGPTGCGKTTTLAAMIDYINNNTQKNIITIEDPIEYIHKTKKSLVSQREVGTHCNSFAGALRAALREDPDIILVGEMRDLETMSLALTAAETGHLVLTTLHTSSAVNAISRIIDVFDPNEQQNIRSMLSNSLNAVILQHLLPATENDHVEAAFEVMVANSSVRNMIREDKLAQINSMMEIGSKHGMVTFKDYVEGMAKDGLISQETATSFLSKF